MINKLIEKIKSLIQKYSDVFGKIMLDNKKRDLFLFKIMNIALFVVSGVMSVVNVFTEFHGLMMSTILFAVGCVINIVIMRKNYKVARTLFKLEFLCLFTFFIITGEPEGFSPFWAPMLPACGLMLFGLVEGLTLDVVMLLIIVFLCWTPVGNSLLMFDYSGSFLLRFPLLYVGYMSVGVILSIILSHTQNAYHELSNHDMLTGALNRLGFVEALGEAFEPSEKVGFMILDLDHFKRVNDTYGHFIGDEVLCYAMKTIQDCCPGCPVCRWGGEEFAVFVNNGAKTKTLAEGIIKALDEGSCTLKDGRKIHQTISCGAVTIDREKFDQDAVSIQADNCLYEAKDSGRNKVVYKEL